MRERNCEQTYSGKIYALPLIKQREFAHRYAEGSNELENLLLYLWQNKIQTFACCAGHSLKLDNPYVLFEINRFSPDQTKSFYHKLMLAIISKNQPCSFLNTGITFFSEDEYHTVCIYFDTLSNENFDFVADLIKSTLVFESVSDYCQRHEINSRLDNSQKNFLKICTELKALEYKKSQSKKIENNFLQPISIVFRNDQRMFQLIDIDPSKMYKSGEFDFKQMRETLSRLQISPNDSESRADNINIKRLS